MSRSVKRTCHILTIRSLRRCFFVASISALSSLASLEFDVAFFTSFKRLVVRIFLMAWSIINLNDFPRRDKRRGKRVRRPMETKAEAERYVCTRGKKGIKVLIYSG